MEDDKLKQIFSDYDPHLSPDVIFMSRLEQNLRSVEFIKERTNTAIRRNKAAMLIACAVGFIAGTGFSLAFPYISAWFRFLGDINLSGWQTTIPVNDIATWGSGCLLTAVLSLASYDVALAVIFNRNDNRTTIAKP